MVCHRWVGRLISVAVVAVTAVSILVCCGLNAIGANQECDCGAPLVEAAVVDAGVDTGPPPRTECFGKTTDAVFICDGFESEWDKAWRPVMLPADPVKANLTITGTPKLAGLTSLETVFSKLPRQGVAKLVYQTPTEEMKLALQFTVNVPNDAWGVGQDVPLGGIISLTRSAIVWFVPEGGPYGHYEVRITGEATPMMFGDVAMSKPPLFDTWQCIELAYDGSRLTAFVSKLADAGVPKPQERVMVLQPHGAEVGIEWQHAPNENASKKFWFEDVVVSRSPIGCIH